jgi:hypothetical protein
MGLQWFRIGASCCEDGTELSGCIKCRDQTGQLVAF